MNDLGSLSRQIRKQYLCELPAISRNVSFAQPFLWTQAMLWNFDPEKHSCIELGYIKGDDFWHYRDKILNYTKLLTEVHKPDFDIDCIQYPLEWKSKADIIKEMSENKLGKLLLKHIRYCEVNQKEQCGKCPSGIKHKTALYENKLKRLQVLIKNRVSVPRILFYFIIYLCTRNHQIQSG